MPFWLLFGTFWKVLASFMFEIVPIHSNNGLFQIHAKPLLGKTTYYTTFIHSYDFEMIHKHLLKKFNPSKMGLG